MNDCKPALRVKMRLIILSIIVHAGFFHGLPAQPVARPADPLTLKMQVVTPTAIFPGSGRGHRHAGQCRCGSWTIVQGEFCEDPETGSRIG